MIDSAATIEAEHEVTVTRVFDAPRDRVFKAWTDPQHVTAWWGPRGYTSYDCKIDLRPGGFFTLEMKAPDGTIYPCKGAFREVVAPERIVLTGAEAPQACGAGLPPGATVTVTFVEHKGKTTLTIHTRLRSAADLVAAVQAGYTAGWEATLGRLSEFLETP